jgi:hypothetical protein
VPEAAAARTAVRPSATDWSAAFAGAGVQVRAIDLHETGPYAGFLNEVVVLDAGGSAFVIVPHLGGGCLGIPPRLLSLHVQPEAHGRIASAAVRWIDEQDIVAAGPAAIAVAVRGLLT